MVKEVERRVKVPEGVALTVEGKKVTVKGAKGELSRDLVFPGVEIRKEDSELVVTSHIDRKQQRAVIGTLAAHVENMIKGVTDGFEYRMKVVYSHFPIQLKATDKEVIINNFLGERKSRTAKINGSAKVELGKDEVFIRGIDKESVGQTMANIEQATRVRGFDVRIFQDGIYLVDKR
ncbi:MAG: 50S ribosomal protein L6 [Methanosaeta sp. PtaB.Bin039]|nr:MAG: 50S ribosomal protein L6 [Methanosaeta sp. PtaB.Bin039]HOT07488.1 50S ribosomal protein L6 [Methanotrichaceae archaeon]HQF16987.1 50S ribosomal protein L6 [Methanotrichaceae archaeon]HQI91607.1 50S ribosomal protein L6 [Methanotrichaceae archaeon]HQJ28899.1 50S ribosomal protein L6 [Methanotrichaceae archaeon]